MLSLNGSFQISSTKWICLFLIYWINKMFFLQWPSTHYACPTLLYDILVTLLSKINHFKPKTTSVTLSFAKTFLVHSSLFCDLAESVGSREQWLWDIARKRNEFLCILLIIINFCQENESTWTNILYISNSLSILLSGASTGIKTFGIES